MKLFKNPPGARGARFGGTALMLVTLFSAALLVALVGGAEAAPTAVGLGTADSFAVLAGAGITNTGPTTINGDIGTFPTTTLVGTSTLTITGTNHAGDAVTQGAKSDLVTAYNTAAGEGPTSPIVADLAGQTLVAGVYNSASSIGLTGAVTLDGGGNPDAVFVFQAGSTLTTGSASRVNLTNGAQACNVFWQIGSSATLGTGTAFRGTIIALTDITLTTGATVEGRVLARNGAVTMDTNTITKPSCAAPPDTAASTDTTATTATTDTTPTTAAPPVSTAILVNAAQATKAATAAATAAKAAKAAKAAAAKARAARATAAKTATAARVAAAKDASRTSAATRAAAAKAAAAKVAAASAVKAAKSAAAKALATKVAAAKARAAHAATLLRISTARAHAETARARAAKTATAIRRNAKPPVQPAGFTG